MYVINWLDIWKRTIDLQQSNESLGKQSCGFFSNRNSQNVLTTSEVRSEKQSGLASASLRKSEIEKKIDC
jgi:hypothetical protein